MAKFRLYGQRNDRESKREIEHRNLARIVASDGMVLLKNEGVLPFKNKNIALYGNGARMTIRGGTGSGDVKERFSVNIEQGLKNAGFTFSNTAWLDRFDNQFEIEKEEFRKSVEEKIKGYGPLKTMQMFDIIHEQKLSYPIGDEIKDTEWAETDTCIYVVARQAGEGGDRRLEKGDYLLSDAEYKNIINCTSRYKNFLLVINSGSIIDLSILDECNIPSVLFFVQGGEEGGNAFSDIVSGKVNPSGKLVDTWAKTYYDYPSSHTYSYLNNDLKEENYYEGIYVGYRYFDAKNILPRFPFGFGLSYTEFTEEIKEVKVEKDLVKLSVNVKNIGKNFSGKQVVQAYITKPNGKLNKEKYSLVSFAKTEELKEQEEKNVNLSFRLSDFASFDENASSFILEKGEYGVFIGSSSGDLTPVLKLNLEKDIVVEKLEHICEKKQNFVDIEILNDEILLDSSLPVFQISEIKRIEKPKIQDDEKAKKLALSLSNDELIELCVGSGYSGKKINITPGACGKTTGNLVKKGIYDINLADGPAGLNVIQKVCYLNNGSVRYIDELPEDWKWGWVKKIAPLVLAKEGKGTPVYQYMTAWPSETLQAQTWDTDLIEKVGIAIGTEMKEIGVTIWLAPGMNIHRNPLCGRNFEYYSEDPVITGLMAAAITKGVQSFDGIGVTIKHFCCNNQEDNRTGVSSNVTERTLREIYLKGFKIAIRDSNPMSIMTSYNMVNGVYTPNSYDLCTKLLRDEWGYNGLIMSDWNATDQCSHSKAIMVGNNLIMPGNKRVKKLLKDAVKNKELSRDALVNSATRILSIIMNSDVNKGEKKI